MPLYQPVHPGTLTISKNSVLHDAIRIHEDHNEKLKHFHETNAIKNIKSDNRYNGVSIHKITYKSIN